MNKKYDAAVLGGGPGGYVAAIRLAQLGKKTVLIEKDELGGTCLNRGCIPTKALLHSAEIFHAAANAGKYGIIAESVGYDYAKIAARKDEVVKKLRNGIKYLLKKAGVEVVCGSGTLVSKNEISVGEDIIYADDIILATGSRPMSIPIPGIETKGVMDSDGVLALTDVPESVVIIGGGVIGIEFATLFNMLENKVTVIEVLPQILTGTDIGIAEKMEGILKGRGVDIFTSSKVTGISSKNGVCCAYQKDGKDFEVCAEICIVAAGRKANIENIGLENAGIDANGKYLEVNGKMQTNIANIYAIGDITGKAQLAHVASAQGIVAAHNIAGQKKHMEYNIVPSCIYTYPEIACVGLDEKAAKEQDYDVKMGSFLSMQNGKSLIQNESDGMVKIVTDAKTGEILGAQIMNTRATDMIAEICAVMKSEGTIEELEDTIHPHPTFSEMIMEAAHDVSGLCIHK